MIQYPVLSARTPTGLVQHFNEQLQPQLHKFKDSISPEDFRILLKNSTKLDPKKVVDKIHEKRTVVAIHCGLCFIFIHIVS